MINVTSEYGTFTNRLLSDRSTLFLIVSNIIMIIFALFENWNLITIMFIYWCQSIIIGFFTFLKMLTLKDFSTEGVNSNTMSPNVGAKIFMSFFFLFHYGMFHFGYYTFLISGAFFASSFASSLGPEPIDAFIIIVIGVFFVNHLFSFLYNSKKDANKKQNIGNIMFYPYIRIIPMHLTILFGGGFMMTGGDARGILILFLLLKTFVDVVMHSIEHREIVANQMKIEIDKINFSPGENISGKLILSLDRPIKADSLTISFVAEKKIMSGSGDNKSTRIYDVYKSEKMIDEQEYCKNTYVFDFLIPPNIIFMVNNFELVEPSYLKLKEYAKKYPWFANTYREYDSFFIRAKFDISLGLDISNKTEITIS